MTGLVEDVVRQRVCEAIFLVGLGIVWWSGEWWPGLLIDFGIAIGLSLLIRRRYWEATVYLVFLTVLPSVYVVYPGPEMLIPALLVGLGGMGLLRAFVKKPE